MQEEKDQKSVPEPPNRGPLDNQLPAPSCPEPLDKSIDYREPNVLVAPEPWTNPWDKGGDSGDGSDNG
jgi:hypothetical protein